MNVGFKVSTNNSFKDAVASIRRTPTEFHYQLAIQRVYEEGEEGLNDGEGTESDLEDETKDERTFLIDEALHINYTERDGRIVIAWRDLSGEPGDQFEFICDKNTKASTFDQFDLISRRCQYERKYIKSHENASEEDLEQFEFEPEVRNSIDLASPVEVTNADISTETKTPKKSPIKGSTETLISTPVKRTPSKAATPAKTANPSTQTPLYPPITPVKQTTPKPPQSSEIRSISGTLMSKHDVSVHLFDAPSGVFMEQTEDATVSIYDQGGYEYWLDVSKNDKKYIGLSITSEMNPCFNYDHRAFIFNLFAQTGAFSWLLRFKDFEALDAFQISFMKALWESNNRIKWTTARDDDQDYILGSFSKMAIDDDEEFHSADEADEADEAEEEEEEPAEEGAGFSRQEDYDSDESYDEVPKFSGASKNSQLAVGYNNDRSYVVRGEKIGVFKQTGNDLEFTAAINKVATSDGKSFSPKKIMLHAQDRSLIVQNPGNSNSLYRMDLEYGKIVDEWKVHEDIGVKAFGPTSKFAQTTDEQTLLGISNNGLFKIDPRLSGNKLVDSQYKKYATKNDFSALATTDSGYIAVASNKGDIRLYDRLGINAKTQLPAMGDPIIGVDVSADGKWILATCKTYLLLIDATIKEGKNAGSVGFLKSFGKDSKPRPKRLQISPEHVAFMQAETGKPLDFTKAHFNTGIDAKEQSIVSSSGPYVITWSLKKLLKGLKEPYLIKRYAAKVAADNFQFGTDKNVIIALEDDVGMASRRSFRKPTRESLATPARRIQAMSRNSVVNSPF